MAYPGATAACLLSICNGEGKKLNNEVLKMG